MLVSNEKMFAILFDKIDCPSISICNNNDTQANKTPKKPLINWLIKLSINIKPIIVVKITTVHQGNNNQNNKIINQ